MTLKVLITIARASSAIGCGMKPSDRLLALRAADSEIESQEVSVDVVANYEIKPVDVVVLRESHNVFRNGGYPFMKKLYQQVNEPLAYKNLAVRLFNSGLDFQLGVANSTFNTQAEAATGAGLLLGNATNQNHIMDATGFDFLSAVQTRLTNTFDRNLAFPITTIKQLLDRSATVGNESTGMIREDAILSILVVGILDEVADSFDTADLIQRLDDLKGPGNWIVSALMPEATGCAYQLNDGTARHSNDFYTPSNFEAYERRNKVLKLQQHSGGIFQSICADSYVDFTDKFVSEGTKTGFFEDDLNSNAQPETIVVRTGDITVEGWKYKPSAHLLMLPTLIKSGTVVSISYKTAPESDDAGWFNPASGRETISKIEDVELSPAEIAYYDGIQDIMQRNCTACHAQYNNFDATWNNRVNIQMRISLPATDPLSMPRNTTWNQPTDRDAVLEWISTYGG